MPAAAVIPAPLAYTKVVAVKKLAVGFSLSPPAGETVGVAALSLSTRSGQVWSTSSPFWVAGGFPCPGHCRGRLP